MAGPLLSLDRVIKRQATRLVVVHRASPAGPSTHALAPGVEALDIREFVEAMAARPRGVRW